ncbi:2,5-dioxovalerate dehydrogenase [Duganella sp. Leaf126]|uniref:aldehyde dehydrogenase (NADP(+)) n=1 Tax=Duganella sp. Leaf126 TaxID=1736266 RepID=UPI0006F2EE33|nr:aldehyde dehydrogenase (NADP(+)) [Duganella sp. Leaf126]KQQ40179.1 2,5-dioxovalerate dehydrogenase [Duganella sp. Leaf126]
MIDATITGEALIAGQAVKGTGAVLRAWDPAAGKQLDAEFFAVDHSQIDAACRAAEAAFDTFRATSDAQRAVFLETVGEQILALGDTLVERVMAETGLPRARVEGERGRTVGQLKLFASLLREGSWNDVRIDAALPDRVPPRPDLRLRMIGLGPVAVFAASNFPLAFSVAGGDTASAFAAGCPVVLRAHFAHPGTSELVGRAVARAVELCGLPGGVFSLLTGAGNAIGQELVRHPAIKAVGFTGSRAGGMALMAVAAARPVPIPVYAEMSSINPVFLLPAALDKRAEDIAAGFAASLTLGVGQMCTNPGLVLALAGPDLDRFTGAAAQALAGTAAAVTMLSPGIAGNFQRGVAQLREQPNVATVSLAPQEEGKGAPALFVTTGAAFLAQHALGEEIFGPASLVVACRDVAELLQVAEQLEGQLTATLQLDDADLEVARTLLPVLERKVGRILANGFPTGVEVASAMVHGGPFPATSDGRSTSVGTGAIVRFLRPVSYQNLPQALLPEVLRDSAPEGWRRRDGELTRH